jgi:DNA-directed RNA polymerase subunit beta'
MGAEKARSRTIEIYDPKDMNNLGRPKKDKITNSTVTPLQSISVPKGRNILVTNGEEVRPGTELIDGDINPHDILKVKKEAALANYLIDEIQEVYRLQGVKINDKHIEVIVRQMLRRVKVTDAGDTPLLIGQVIDRNKFEQINKSLMLQGRYEHYRILDYRQFLDTDTSLKIMEITQKLAQERQGEDENRKPSQDAKPWRAGQLVPLDEYREGIERLETNGVQEILGEPALGKAEPILLGITKASLSTDSFLSAASFQETTRVLTEATINGKIDTLRGLKENILMGRLIPAGTGFAAYQNLKMKTIRDVDTKNIKE